MPTWNSKCSTFGQRYFLFSKYSVRNVQVIEHQENSNNNFAPECNGQSERMMSAISNSLAKNIDDEANWDSLIRFIQFAYNNSPCLDSTDYIPFFFIHGRHPRSLLDVNIDNFDIPITCRDYVISLMDNIENARTTAVETLKERKQQMKNKAYISTQEPSFTVGDIVYVYRPVVTHGRQKKIIRPWVAPFYIAQKLSLLHVKIRRKSDGKLIKNRVHINRLKHGFA